MLVNCWSSSDRWQSAGTQCPIENPGIDHEISSGYSLVATLMVQVAALANAAPDVDNAVKIPVEPSPKYPKTSPTAPLKQLKRPRMLRHASKKTGHGVKQGARDDSTAVHQHMVRG